MPYKVNMISKKKHPTHLTTPEPIWLSFKKIKKMKTLCVKVKGYKSSQCPCPFQVLNAFRVYANVGRQQISKQFNSCTGNINIHIIKNIVWSKNGSVKVHFLSTDCCISVKINFNKQNALLTFTRKVILALFRLLYTRFSLISGQE